MTGKWHLEREPTGFGFERYFGHLSGACNFFKGDSSFRLNGEQWSVPAVLNDKTFYTTVADVDFAIDFLSEARKSGEALLPLCRLQCTSCSSSRACLKTTPSTRVATPRAGMRYVTPASRNRCSRGFSPIRLRPAHAHLMSGLGKTSFRGSATYETNRMVTLAAMIDRVDQEVGRLVDNLKEHDELDNTLHPFCF